MIKGDIVIIIMDGNRPNLVLSDVEGSVLPGDDVNMDEFAQNERKRVRNHPGSDNEETDSKPKRLQQMRYEHENQGNESGENVIPNQPTPNESSPNTVSKNVTQSSRSQVSSDQSVEIHGNGSTEQLENPHIGEDQSWNTMQQNQRSHPNVNRISNVSNYDQETEGGLIIMELIDKSRDGKLIQDRATLKYMLKKSPFGTKYSGRPIFNVDTQSMK